MIDSMIDFRFLKSPFGLCIDSSIKKLIQNPKGDLRDRKSIHKVNFENQNVETTGSKNRGFEKKKNPKKILKNWGNPRKS